MLVCGGEGGSIDFPFLYISCVVCGGEGWNKIVCCLWGGEGWNNGIIGLLGISINDVIFSLSLHLQLDHPPPLSLSLSPQIMYTYFK